jgi:hypothetical protein
MSARPRRGSVEPPSGTAWFMTGGRGAGGRGWGVALALWLNAKIRAQKAAERIASFFFGSLFTFITNV